MKTRFRDLYNDCIEDLVWDCVDVNMTMEELHLMSSPIKYVYIDNIRTQSKLALMPVHRPILIPFKVGKYNLRLDYKDEL